MTQKKKGYLRLLTPPDNLGSLVRSIRRLRINSIRHILSIVILVILGLCGTLLLMQNQTYGKARTSDQYPSNTTDSSRFERFADGVVRYNRDGVTFLNKKNEEIWMQPTQLQNPSIVVKEKAFVVADSGGNNILVFSEEGLKGEIETTLPIEKVAVSSQGIVAAVLHGDGDPQIVCYDAAGNILAELDTTVTGNGYPLDISLSENGQLLLVSYMTVQNGRTVSNIYYYNFGEAGAQAENYEVLTDTYEDVIAPTAFFMDGDTSAVVGNDRVLIYRGQDTPSLQNTIELDKQIKSAFYSPSYIGLVLKNEGEAGYELRLYNKSGSMVMSEKFTGEYSNVKICGMQVIMYGGTQCSVFTRAGIHRFEGEMDDPILEMFPVFGVNKYIVMNANGMEVVRFVK